MACAPAIDLTTRFEVVPQHTSGWGGGWGAKENHNSGVVLRSGACGLIHLVVFCGSMPP